jgi:F0F1-type ATP synthase assembly protein I
MFVTPLVGWAIGKFIQTRFDTGQWVVVLFSCLGVLAAIREVARVIKRASEDDT